MTKLPVIPPKKLISILEKIWICGESRFRQPCYFKSLGRQKKGCCSLPRERFAQRNLDGSVAELALAAISIFRLRQIRQSSAYFKPSMPSPSSFFSREI